MSWPQLQHAGLCQPGSSTLWICCPVCPCACFSCHQDLSAFSNCSTQHGHPAYHRWCFGKLFPCFSPQLSSLVLELAWDGWSNISLGAQTICLTLPSQILWVLNVYSTKMNKTNQESPYSVSAELFWGLSIWFGVYPGTAPLKRMKLQEMHWRKYSRVPLHPVISALGVISTFIAFPVFFLLPFFGLVFLPPGLNILDGKVVFCSS
jgi:hypothetical protein